MSDDLAILQMDASGLMSALDRMIPQSKQELGDLLVNEVAKPLIRKIISITPPSHGSADNAAKKAGEALIRSDIGRIMKPGSDGYIAALRRNWGGDVWREGFGHAGAAMIGDTYTAIIEGSQDIADWHNRRRSKSTGRVGFMGKSKVANWSRQEKRGLLRTNIERAQAMTTGVRKRDLVNLDLAIVPKRQFDNYLALMKGKVGELASGWNAAAAALNVARPAWISRHGDRLGQVVMELDGERMRILFSNDTPYANNVRDFAARVQKAVDWQARDMNRRVDEYARKERKL